MAKKISGEEKRENMEAAGIPDSKPFGGGDNALEDPILDCHVGGVLVRDMLAGMSDSMAAVILSGLSYAQTDEGFAERNKDKSAHHVSVASDGFDKALEQRRDDVRDREMAGYEARDPLKEVYDQHVGKGMRGKFLSSRKVKENGGTGDYQIVKDANGDPVSVRGMVLGQMPEERALARSRFYRARGNRLLTEMTAKYKAEGGKTAVADQ